MSSDKVKMDRVRIESAITRFKASLNNDSVAADAADMISNPKKGSAQTLRVSKDPAKGDFSSIEDALATITDSSETKQYVIEVGPGHFKEPVIDLRAKPYVSIKGSGWTSTYLLPKNSSQTRLILLGMQTNISHMLLSGRPGIENPINAGIVLIATENHGDELGANIEHCQMWSASTFVKVTNATWHESSVTLQNCQLHGNFSEALHVEQTGTEGGFAVLECYEVTAVPQYNTVPSIMGVAKGKGSFLWMYGGYLYDFSGESYAGPNYTGQFSKGFEVENGCDVELANVTVYGFKEAISIKSNGEAPQVRLSNVKCIYSLEKDLNNLHTATAGSFSGVADKSKVTNASSSLSEMYQDITSNRVRMKSAKFDLSGDMLPAAVAPIASPSSASAADVANKLNDVIAALKAAGLMAE